MKIKIIDHVHCQADSPKILKEFLTVRRTFWKKGLYHQERTEYDHPLIDKQGMFLSGFLPRVVKNLEKRGISTEIEGEFEKAKYKWPIIYPEITLWEDQKKMVQIALEQQRGIFQAPTGTGKTVLCYAIIYPLMPCKALVICPSKSIMSQTAREFHDKFSLKTSVYGDGTKDLSGDVVVGLINSLHRIPPEEYCSLFDVVIADETHHLSLDGMYYKFLTNCLAPVRIGLTATADKEGTEKAMAFEGLLGPMIGKFTFGEAVEAKRIAKPKMILLPIPINSNLRDIRTYQEIYRIGIVYNRVRNSIIVKFIAEQAKEGKTAIVFVKLLDHASILLGMMREKGVLCEYVSGEVDDRERQRIKSLLRTKQINCVISTSVWKEGLDLPELSIVANCAGYLSDKPVIQMAGRVLRIAEGKTEGIIVDFLDCGKYLSEHCVRRLLTYAELGWL